MYISRGVMHKGMHLLVDSMYVSRRNLYVSWLFARVTRGCCVKELMVSVMKPLAYLMEENVVI